jgi:hypothetical protein
MQKKGGAASAGGRTQSGTQSCLSALTTRKLLILRVARIARIAKNAGVGDAVVTWKLVFHDLPLEPFTPRDGQQFMPAGLCVNPRKSFLGFSFLSFDFPDRVASRSEAVPLGRLE